MSNISLRTFIYVLYLVQIVYTCNTIIAVNFATNLFLFETCIYLYLWEKKSCTRAVRTECNSLRAPRAGNLCTTPRDGNRDDVFNCHELPIEEYLRKWNCVCFPLFVFAETHSHKGFPNKCSLLIFKFRPAYNSTTAEDWRSSPIFCCCVMMSVHYTENYYHVFHVRLRKD